MANKEVEKNNDEKVKENINVEEKEEEEINEGIKENKEKEEKEKIKQEKEEMNIILEKNEEIKENKELEINGFNKDNNIKNEKEEERKIEDIKVTKEIEINTKKPKIFNEEIKNLYEKNIFIEEKGGNNPLENITKTIVYNKEPEKEKIIIKEEQIKEGIDNMNIKDKENKKENDNKLLLVNKENEINIDEKEKIIEIKNMAKIYPELTDNKKPSIFSNFNILNNLINIDLQYKKTQINEIEDNNINKEIESVKINLISKKDINKENEKESKLPQNVNIEEIKENLDNNNNYFVKKIEIDKNIKNKQIFIEDKNISNNENNDEKIENIDNIKNIDKNENLEINTREKNKSQKKEINIIDEQETENKTINSQKDKDNNILISNIFDSSKINISSNNNKDNKKEMETIRQISTSDNNNKIFLDKINEHSNMDEIPKKEILDNSKNIMSKKLIYEVKEPITDNKKINIINLENQDIKETNIKEKTNNPISIIKDKSINCDKNKNIQKNIFKIFAPSIDNKKPILFDFNENLLEKNKALYLKAANKKINPCEIDSNKIYIDDINKINNSFDNCEINYRNKYIEKKEKNSDDNEKNKKDVKKKDSILNSEFIEEKKNIKTNDNILNPEFVEEKINNSIKINNENIDNKKSYIFDLNGIDTNINNIRACYNKLYIKNINNNIIIDNKKLDLQNVNNTIYDIDILYEQMIKKENEIKVKNKIDFSDNLNNNNINIVKEKKTETSVKTIENKVMDNKKPNIPEIESITTNIFNITGKKSNKKEINNINIDPYKVNLFDINKFNEMFKDIELKLSSWSENDEKLEKEEDRININIFTKNLDKQNEKDDNKEKNYKKNKIEIFMKENNIITKIQKENNERTEQNEQKEQNERNIDINKENIIIKK